MDRVTLPANMESLDGFRSFVLGKLEGWNLAPAIAAKIELVLEEVLTNIMNYAYPDGEGNVEVGCELQSEEQRVQLVILDWGTPFDPLSRSAPDVSADITEREAGGLGIFLLRNMVEELHYKRRDNKNILTLSLALT